MTEKPSTMKAIAEAFVGRVDAAKPRKAGKVDEMVAPHKSPEIANALRRCREAAEAARTAQSELDAANAALLAIVHGQ